MEAAVSPLPDGVEALRALVRLSTERADAAEQRAASVEAKLANARARESATETLEQMEFELENLEADATEDDLKAATAKTTTVTAFEGKRLVKKPFPEHLPRERVVVPAPCSCPACGGNRLSKLGEDVTETLVD